MSEKYDKTEISFQKAEYEFFVSEAMLNDEEIHILKWRILGWSITKIRLELRELGIYYSSNKTVSNRITAIRAKYDRLQEKYPDKLPHRRPSQVEKWMDDPNSVGVYNGKSTDMDTSDFDGNK